MKCSTREVNSNKSYIKKQERTPMKNLTLHLLEPEKKIQIKPKVSRRKEPIKIREKVN